MGNKIINNKKYNSVIIYFALIMIYIVLGELTSLLNFLPKPSILFESFVSLWSDYNLFAELSISTAAVYLGLLFGIAILELLSKYLISLKNESGKVFEYFAFLKYFPAFFFAILFSFWFPDSIIAEIIFSTLAVLAILIPFAQKAFSDANKSFIDSALSYKVSKSELTNIIWKDSQPKIYEKLTRVHYYLWILIMIFEFIGAYNGVGSVYYKAHNFNDYTAFFSLAILIAILIWLGDSLIRLLKNKIIFWE